MGNGVTTAPVAERLDRRITNSEIQTAKTCLRKHQLAYGLGLRKAESVQALRFGNAFHIGLDVRADGMIHNLPREEIVTQMIDAALAAYDKGAPTVDDEKYAGYLVERTILVTLLNAYDWRWHRFDKKIKVIATEQVFDVPIVNPETGRSSRTFTFAGKIDKIVQLEDGRIVIMEHKTAGQDIYPDSDYWKRLRIDSQISGYYIAATQLGYAVESVLYDVVRKPGIRPAEITQGRTKTLIETGTYYAKGDTEDIAVGEVGSVEITRNEAGEPVAVTVNGESSEVIMGKKGFSIRETPTLYSMRLNHEIATNQGHYFQRNELPRTEADLEEARFELWEEGQRIHHHAKRGMYPRNTQACIGFGKCPFFDLCTTGYDPASGDVPEGFYALGSGAVHSELMED